MNNPQPPYQPTMPPQPQPESNKKLWIILGLLIGVPTILMGGCVACVALLGLAGAGNTNVANNNPVPSPSAPSQTASASSDNVTADANASPTSPPAYTDKEYQLYREMTDSPGSEPESKIFERLGKKYGMSAKEVRAAVERVVTALHSGGAATNRNREQEIQEAVGKLAKVKTVNVSSEFAGVAYVEQAAAWDDADVRRKVLERMPVVLEAIFAVSGIERVRLIAYYPATDGGEAKIASFEAYRSEFKTGKRPEEYSEFWVRPPAR